MIEPADPTQADCRRCPHAQDIGPDRVACHHPKALEVAGGLEAHIRRITGGVGPVGLSALGISADAAAITSGSFMWPDNFDPTALRSCAGCPKVKVIQEAQGSPSQRVGPRIHIG
jgi:hypothetical protein